LHRTAAFQQITQWMRCEIQQWGKVVKDHNIKAE